MITFQFSDAKFQARFSGIIARSKNPRGILLAAGRRGSEVLRDHFRRKQASNPNRLSPRRSDFWLKVRQSVNNPFLGIDASTGQPKFSFGEGDKPDPQFDGSNAVVISINHPAFAQKVFGGRIEAKEAGALTIPEEERAYGRTAATFEQETGLKLFLIRSGNSAFQNALLAVKDDNERGFTVEYLLTPSVEQQADAEALPPKTALEAAILKTAQRALDRQNEDQT